MQIAPPHFDRMFGALADHTRRDIVRRAIDGGEGVTELARHYPMSFAAVQKHIAVLERAGLVTKVVPAANLLEEAKELATKLAMIERMSTTVMRPRW